MNPTRRTSRTKRALGRAALVVSLATAGAACVGGLDSTPGGDDGGGGGGGGGGGDGGGADAGPGDSWDERLNERTPNYGAALRTAALRLTGDLPTLAEIKGVTEGSDVAAAYRAQLEAYLDDPRFARQMVEFWRDTLKMGDDDVLESAPVFAAQVVVEGRPFTDLLTATGGTCPSFDEGAGRFTAGDCDNGAPVTAGLLSHPGVMRQFNSNLAFRRVRWVQEIFACTAFPAELAAPQDVGGASVYTAPWPFDSIGSPATGGDIDFLDVSSVTCANCHATMNHIAPLFGNFDEDGNYQGAIQVRKPTADNPRVELADWLPPGEATAWREGVPAADLGELGAAMAADPLIAECAVARTWNWAFGKADIVDTLSLVPSEVIATQVTDFESGGFDLRATILAVLASDDFIKF